jgi:adenylate cyclase
LAMWDRRVAARVCKSFLECVTRLVRARGGDVRSFDGDRVMGVFVGNNKNTAAVRCALQINWMFTQLLKPKFNAKYAKLADGSYKLAHCTGVDVSEVLVVRAGIRNNNDLIWVGQASNIAAKLSGLRDSPYNTFITGAVYDSVADEVKLSGQTNMWEERTWTNGLIKRVFRSNWHWKP